MEWSGKIKENGNTERRNTDHLQRGKYKKKVDIS